ncbi:Rrf2 family transcriptional regulator [candidate division KSB1 bacterium]|nr:Rrf2 family transcriptional regulator [candidate division KSB1 bacterium]RQW01272.1 MAG: Rrf2 family transcriptional regulator [candidate division KSB1 bacterium]
MFKLSKKTEYGILALQHMMRLDENCVATVKEIAEQHDIPQSLLAKICQQLAKSKIIQSVQGSRGGYTLNKQPSDISLAAVLEAIEGPIHIVDCTLAHHSCKRDDNCSLKMSLDPIEQQLSIFLKSVTLASFATSPQGEVL